MSNGIKYETIIGLEVHAQLNTASKMFCGCETTFGQQPNSQTCPVCLGMPGVLPAINRKAVEYAAKMGLATNCHINEVSNFARKNYFYPDLPKGYQITQYEKPLCENGFLLIDTDRGEKKIGIARIHIEEDAGKSIHSESWIKKDVTLVDLNRCGIPLIEIVSHPQIHSPEEARTYLTVLKQILIYLDICDGNMEKGNLRCDANISIRTCGQSAFGNKTELKNMNSFRTVEKALEYERNRQIDILNSNRKVTEDTLLWDDVRNIAVPMRKKEKSHDYRYFPEPDLIPIQINTKQIEQLRQEIPELPAERRNRFIYEFNLSRYKANILTEKKPVADYFEEAAHKTQYPNLTAKWVVGEILHLMKDNSQDDHIPVKNEKFVEVLLLLKKEIINQTTAKEVLKEIAETGENATELIKEKKLFQVSDSDKLKNIVERVVQANLLAVKKYKAGKTEIVDFIIGQVMRETKGRANPQIVNRIVTKILSDL